MVNTRTHVLLAVHRNAHLCELPRVLWWDAEGRAHYSIPSPRDKPSPNWRLWAIAAALAMSLFGGAAMTWVQGL